jgi:hypothetical protein
LERPFAGLVVEQQIPRVVRGIEVAVLKSFEEDAARQSVILVRQVTRSEQKRRVALCLKIFRELRGDLKWGVERIVDSLPHFLRCELDGIAWSPEAKRATWGSNEKPITQEETP